MGLANAGLAVVEPLFDGLVLVPGVVTGEDLDSGHGGLVEDLVLLLEECDGLLGGLVLVDSGLSLVEEGGLFLDLLMLFNNVRVASGQTLDVVQVLLVGLFVDPRVLNFHFFRFQGFLLLLGQQGVLLDGAMRLGSLLLFTQPGHGGASLLCALQLIGICGLSNSERFHLRSFLCRLFEAFILFLLETRRNLAEVRHSCLQRRAWGDVRTLHLPNYLLCPCFLL
mmetsp:Transcript_20668/g.31558  ORF Transcript_20668/g.31558 Transcript_20668/m.31558 type:complete len:224 (+) Transcript_20668:7277-7948(+)